MTKLAWFLFAVCCAAACSGCGHTTIRKGDVEIIDTQFMRDRSLGGVEYTRLPDGSVSVKVTDTKAGGAPELLRGMADAIEKAK